MGNKIKLFDCVEFDSIDDVFVTLNSLSQPDSVLMLIKAVGKASDAGVYTKTEEEFIVRSIKNLVKNTEVLDGTCN